MYPVLLIINTGSSSLKFSLYSTENFSLDAQAVCSGQIESLQDEATFSIKEAKKNNVVKTQCNLANAGSNNIYNAALNFLLNWLTENTSYVINAAGHRVVHGGNLFTAPMIATQEVLIELEKFIPLAPLHQPYNLAGVKTLAEIYPNLLQVICFDTTFHTSQSSVAQAFALPEVIAPLPIKRYGFHGLSYEYIASVLPDYLDQQADGKIIVAHLGHGASMCAMDNRRSIATTMGLTALDGLPMGTRCGSLDPGIILYLLKQTSLQIDEVEDLLYKKSGLLGVSGISSDVRTLLKDPRLQARQALDLFTYRINRELGSLVAALGGLDTLLFTAGIGENAPFIRAQVCQQAKWLGIELDKKANSENARKISTANSPVSVWVIPTNEEVIIAKHTWQLLRKHQGLSPLI